MKQYVLVTATAFARETPGLRFNAVEPGFASGTSLGMRDVNAFVRVLVEVLAPVIVPLLASGLPVYGGGPTGGTHRRTLARFVSCRGTRLDNDL